MHESQAEPDEIRVYRPEGRDEPTMIIIPATIQKRMGISKGQSLLVTVRDAQPRQLQIARATPFGGPLDGITVRARPERGCPGLFSCRLPREWLDQHWRRNPHATDDDDPYISIEGDYSPEQVWHLWNED